MKKLNLLFVVGFTQVLCYAQPSPNPGTSYSIKSTVDPTKALTGGNPVTHNAEAVCLNRPGSGGNNNFLWKFESVTGGYYKIKNEGINKYLAVWGGSRDNGVGTVLWTDNGQSDIFWSLIASGDPSTGYTYKIKNRKSNLYLAISGGSTANGAEAIQYRDEGQADIKWRLVKDAPVITIAGEPVPGPLIFPKSQWIPIFTRALSGFKMNINNYTDKAFSDVNNNTFKFSKRNDCLFKFDAKEAKFGIVPIRMDPATIYFIDLISQPPSITNNGSQMSILINYDMDGYEALGNCIDNISCGDGMWWINIDAMRIVLKFTPVIVAGKISYSNMGVTVTGRVQSAGTNLVVQNFNNNALFNKLAENIKKTLETAEYKAIFARGISAGFIREYIGTSALIREEPLSYNSISILSNGDLKFDR